MKVGVNHWVWVSPFKTSRDKNLVSRAKSLGAEVLEFDYEDDAEFDTAELKKFLTEHDLRSTLIALMGPDRDLSIADADIRQNGMDYARRGVDTIAAMGGDLFTGSVCGVAGDTLLLDTDLTSRLQQAGECMHELGEYAAGAGVRLSVEVLNRYENNILHSVDNGMRLVKYTDHASVGVHLDCFHMSMEEPSLTDAIRKAGSKLFHLQAQRVTGANRVPD